jgi:hypothetical protein
MIRLLILLCLTALLAIGLVAYALTDWSAAAWFSLVAALAIPILGILFRIAWPAGDDELDIDLDL